MIKKVEHDNNKVRKGKLYFHSVLLDSIILLTVIVGILCIFINKAFTIDDPLFIWLGKHILNEPFDFYRYMINWEYSVMPMYEITYNPPLTGYFIAAAMIFIDMNEISLHAVFLFPAAAAAAGTYLLSKRLCSLPLEASFISLLTPVFLISSTNVMSDTLMLSLWCWSLYLWIKGFDKQCWIWLLVSAILACLAVLTKYYSIALVPLLITYSLIRSRKLGIWCLFLLLPILTIVIYSLITMLLYDTNLISYVSKISIGFKSKDDCGVVQLFIGLAFAGGCLIPVIFYAPLIWSRRSMEIGIGLYLLTLTILLLIHCMIELDVKYIVRYNWTWYSIAQFAIYSLGGVSLVMLCISDIWRNRDDESCLLFLWVIGTIVFASFVNWMNNGRSNLPLAPAVGILIVRRLEYNCKKEIKLWSLKRLIAFIPCLLFTIIVTYSDYQWANEVKKAANEISQKYIDDNYSTYFQGHWGFQYYMELAGAKSLDSKRAIKPGSIVVTPHNNTNIRLLDKNKFSFIETIKQKKPNWVRTNSTHWCAGFYGSKIGPMPFVIGSGPVDKYKIFIAKN